MPRRGRSVAVALVAIVAWEGGNGMQLFRPWSQSQWCESVVEPHWPFAYEKDPVANDRVEGKGRTALDVRNHGHVCTTRGVQSKCHRCEEIQCGNGNGAGVCQYQVQGVPWVDMAENVYTPSDVPWAVKGSHRNDFGGASTTHVCLMLSAECADATRTGFDFSGCTTRCWGLGVGRASPKAFRDQTPDPMPNRAETVGWEWDEKALAKRPQGKVSLLAGSSTGESGHRDGPALDALFKNPSGVAVDKEGNVYVADSGNHCIRMVEKATGIVSTLAGIPGQPGATDGIVGSATFDNPTGITLYYDWGVKVDSRTGSAVSRGIGELVLVVSDTGNHRLRRIVFTQGVSAGSLRVDTLAGRRGREPGPGFSDGDSTEARFNVPRGLAADDSGVVFVADSFNHLIRQVMPNGDVITLAGSVATPQEWLEQFGPQEQSSKSCEAPCLRGVPGQEDGSLRSSKFFFPSDVAIGLQDTILVADGNRIRRVTRKDTTSVIQGQVLTDSVTTVAGQSGDASIGKVDGPGEEASFNVPSGVAMDTLTGRIFVADTGSCRLRRITPADQVARNLTCRDTLVDVLRPSGCQSYEPPLDEVFLKASDVAGNVHYNFEQRHVQGLLGNWSLAGRSFQGRSVHRCLGSPPPLRGMRSSGDTLGPRSDTASELFEWDEDTDQGTAIHVRCPASCGASSLAAVVGENRGSGAGAAYGFADSSSICRAAVHAGLVDDSLGGLVRVVVLPGTRDALDGSTRSGVTSSGLSDGVLRGFALEAYPERLVQVATVAGLASALLGQACGTPGALEGAGGYSLPLASQFRMPQGVAIPANRSLSKGGLDLLYIADTGNHAIRSSTAVCAKICENGGECVGDEQCQCSPGWTGDDCTTPVCASGCGANTRTVCVAPDTCDCVPGYSGFPACLTALCVQTCENGGSCVAPDTCGCATGWLDANCTTPVCDQTCGNGGNCTGPSECSCPSDWTGADCRTPVCTQACANGGSCIAPDTCYCPPEWSGHDCTLPVCLQGFVVADPSDHWLSFERRSARVADALRRPLHGRGASLLEELDGTHWRQFAPCDDSFAPLTWCGATNEFDCAQPARSQEPSLVLRGEQWRGVSGFGPAGSPLSGGAAVEDWPSCVRLELSIGARTWFPYEREAADGNLTDLWRYPPTTAYGWDAAFAPGPDSLADKSAGRLGWRASAPASSDRMVAWAKWTSVAQGVYVCANGGNCTAPGVCVCAPGWIGFDCRTPVCDQGYYEPPSMANPGQVEFDLGVLVPQRYPDQGLYECSIRSVTQWENASYLWEHPNYYSRYMDHHEEEWSPDRYQLEPESPYYWNNMGWPATYVHSEPDGNHTNMGWTRKGTWSRAPNAKWQKGTCTVEYKRFCPLDASKELDVRDMGLGTLVLDTEAAFRPVVVVTDEKVQAIGRWTLDGGECVDHVQRGCMNNGTCVAPGTCSCAEGWTGPDCTEPVCEQSCARQDSLNLGVDSNGLKVFTQGKGWCTLPNTCTCERGWSGESCKTPLCAQECNNGGKCTAPDTCTCSRWESPWRDGQHTGGRPVFQDDTGRAMLTGWTGYDCATPICVQAERFVLNDQVGTVRLGGYGLILYGEEPFNNLRRADLRGPPYYPYTLTNDIPPVKVWLPSMREYDEAIWADDNVDIVQEAFRLCRMKGQRFCTRFPDSEPLPPTWSPGDGEVVRNDGRSFQSGCVPWSNRFSDMLEGVSDGFLCNVLRWEQGDYTEGRYIRQSNEATSYLLNLTVSAEALSYPRWYKDVRAAPGEGVYECHNHGSCVRPDVCSCPDGFTGPACATPLCRHRQASGQVVSCENGGTCVAKDKCGCVQTESILHLTYAPDVKSGMTGYNGTDCSIPMCMQGTFDPTCEGVAPGGEGCFRCKNGGNCTAPDFCTCPPEWTGYDCGTPVCTLRADSAIVEELQTMDVVKVHQFELDPCQHSKQVLWNGFYSSHGNCTAPGLCTCFCRDRAWLEEDEWTGAPWSHPLGFPPPLGYVEGSLQCIDGFEGTKDNSTGLFRSCHLKIYVPKWYERFAITLIVLSVLVLLGAIGAYIETRRRIRRQYLVARAERRLANDDDQVMPLKKKKVAIRKGQGVKATKKKRRNDRKVA